MESGWSVKRPLLWALARVIWSGTVGGRAAVVCAPFPKRLSDDVPLPDPPIAPRRAASTTRAKWGSRKGVRSVEVAQPSTAGLEFTPQAGQPNGNKKLRQTALPTPRRPVNIAPTTPAGGVVRRRRGGPTRLFSGFSKRRLAGYRRVAAGGAAEGRPKWRKLFVQQLLAR